MKHKKLLIGVAVVAALLVVSSIGNYWNSQKPAPAASSQPPAASDPAPVENPLMVADFKTADIMNGLNTEKIGEYGYIELPKSGAENITGDQLVEFCEKKVDGSGLSRVMIFFDDGTGIHINIDSWFVSMDYGNIDPETGLISTTVLGTIQRVQKDGEMTNDFEYIPSAN